MPTRPVLRRCREWHGTADLIAGKPGLRHLTEAVYVPYPSAGQWGLYEHGGEVGGANPQAVGQTLQTAPAAGDRAALDEAYLYLGWMVAHYGHFVTDVMARLWPLLTWSGPRPRLLYHGSTQAMPWREQTFIHDILGRFGLGVDDLVAFDEVRTIRNLVVCEPGFVAGQQAHHVHRDLCKHVGRPFWRDADVDTVEKPVFLSKLKLPQAALHQARNEAALVDALDRRGVDIVFPETLDFARQVDLMARRRVVMGIAGSALHTSLFSAPQRRLIALHWWPYLNTNFVICDALNGNAAYYYWHRKVDVTQEAAFVLRYTIHNPERVAAEMLERAAAFDSIEARDLREDDARRRWARSLPGHAARFVRRVGIRLGSMTTKLRNGS